MPEAPPRKRVARSTRPNGEGKPRSGRCQASKHRQTEKPLEGMSIGKQEISWQKSFLQALKGSGFKDYQLQGKEVPSPPQVAPDLVGTDLENRTADSFRCSSEKHTPRLPVDSISSTSSTSSDLPSANEAESCCLHSYHQRPTHSVQPGGAIVTLSRRLNP